MGSFVDSFFNLQVLADVYPLLVQGLRVTVGLVLVSIPLATAFGLGFGTMQSVRARWLRILIELYIDFMRAIPPLVLLILIFYGLPFVGLKLAPFPAAVLALVLNGSSYYGEIFRAGINSIPKGQFEAARSTGLNASQAMIYVVIPQAVRNVLPDLITNTLELIKQTAIASAVALQELLRSAQIAQGLVYNPTPLVAAALAYFVLLWPLVRLISRFERGMAVSR